MVPPGGISLVNFDDRAYQMGKFLNGDYPSPYPVYLDLMWAALPTAKRTPSAEGYRVNNLASRLNDYSGHEDRSALYAMVTLNIGEQITILPGVRYQNLATSYTAMQGEAVPGGIVGSIVTAEKSHGYVLPMVHLRYKPLDWAQFHFAYTNTLNYPDYSSITPRFYVGSNFIAYNNVNLKPATSENFDLVASLHSNDLGLLSVDGFKKRIKDLIFYSQRYLSDLSAYPELPQGRKTLYEFDTYINNPIAIDVWGIETEWQTHFWYLPAPFDGIVFNINYTHIFSEASYPKSTLENQYDEFGNLVQIVHDTSYTTRLLNQPNDILNLAVGYDLGGFSARLSMLFQDNIFKRPDFWMQNRVNSAKYTRWDFSARQQLPWLGLQLYFSINNMFGENDVDVNQKTSFPASEQRYGMSSDLGLRIDF
jgi:TonB-dependent receptor